MDRNRLRRLLGDVRRGKVTPAQGLEALTTLPFETARDATVDHHRGLRQHLPEVILCESKTAEQCVTIARKIATRSGRCLATRVKPEHGRALVEAFGDAASWNETARTVVVTAGRRLSAPRANGAGSVLVVSAGTSDAPVAEEAAVTLEFMSPRHARERRGRGGHSSAARASPRAPTRERDRGGGRHGRRARQRGGRADGSARDRGADERGV